MVHGVKDALSRVSRRSENPNSTFRPVHRTDQRSSTPAQRATFVPILLPRSCAPFSSGILTHRQGCSNAAAPIPPRVSAIRTLVSSLSHRVQLSHRPDPPGLAFVLSWGTPPLRIQVSHLGVRTSHHRFLRPKRESPTSHQSARASRNVSRRVIARRNSSTAHSFPMSNPTTESQDRMHCLPFGPSPRL